jgi:hypothetical protein
MPAAYAVCIPGHLKAVIMRRFSGDTLVMSRKRFSIPHISWNLVFRLSVSKIFRAQNESETSWLVGICGGIEEYLDID